ncbi:hypothetical protein [Rhodococcus sp. NPDC047139]|uniref:hypothetical protein n=1 Tax=Rhodococcus sp. NPDC047139 TaxID=3155141 RepID=UPI0033FC42B1
MRIPPGEASSILDEGTAGLVRLTEHLPLLHALGYASGITVADVRARYDEHRALSLSALTDDAAVSRGLAQTMGRRVDDQRRLLLRLDEAWDGSAGEGARADLAATITSGAGLCTSLRDLAAALEKAATDIAGALREKARVTGDLADVTVDGRTTDEIATIVEGARGGPHGPTPEEAARWFGEATDPAVQCRRWVAERLVPTVLGTLDDLFRACEEAGRRVAEALTDLTKETGRAVESAEAAVGVSGAGASTGLSAEPLREERPPQDGPATSERSDHGAAAPLPASRSAERKREHAAGPVADSGNDAREEHEESGDGVVLAEAGPL